MSLNPTMWNVPLTALDVWNTARITELNLSTSLSSPLSLCSITAVRRMILRWTWALWRERTLSHTSPATPATPSPWTARPSTPSLWTSWKRARTTTTARPARRTPSAPDTQTTCVTEASVWASTPTTRTRPSPSRCPPTRRAPPLWVSTAPRTCFLPRRAPTAPWSDLCCTRNTHTHTGKTENTHHTYTQHMTFLFETTFRWWIRIQHSNTHTHTNITAHVPSCHRFQTHSSKGGVTQKLSLLVGNASLDRARGELQTSAINDVLSAGTWCRTQVLLKQHVVLKCVFADQISAVIQSTFMWTQNGLVQRVESVFSCGCHRERFSTIPVTLD